jgi:hypothetical protein
MAKVHRRPCNAREARPTRAGRAGWNLHRPAARGAIGWRAGLRRLRSKQRGLGGSTRRNRDSRPLLACHVRVDKLPKLGVGGSARVFVASMRRCGRRAVVNGGRRSSECCVAIGAIDRCGPCWCQVYKNIINSIGFYIKKIRFMTSMLCPQNHHQPKHIVTMDALCKLQVLF